jgi:GrpB-like predicted nucleotidyltransferase (UPF0157 family)
MRFLNPEQYQKQSWDLFEILKTRIQSTLRDARVEHIGSSSIEGCISKGDLDIFVGVASAEFKSAILSLQSFGCEIKHGSFRSDELCPFELKGYELEVGIQLVSNGSKFEFFIEFRDRIRNSRALLEEYNQLKNNCVELAADEYRKVKSQFIESVLLLNPGKRS